MKTDQQGGTATLERDDVLKRNPYLPVSLEVRAKEKAAIKEEQRKNRPRLLDCLDPTVAKRYEDAKPLYEWKVSCKLFRAATAKTHARVEKIERTVVAQNDNDAWARFCDEIGEWPSRRDSEPSIVQLKERKLRGEN